MFDWMEFFEFGMNLIGECSECDQRVGVSRAYYGLFNMAIKTLPADLAQDLRTDKSQKGYHELVWENLFQNSDDKENDRALMASAIIRKARNKADYDSSSNIFKTELNGFKKSALIVFNQIKKIRSK